MMGTGPAVVICLLLLGAGCTAKSGPSPPAPRTVGASAQPSGAPPGVLEADASNVRAPERVVAEAAALTPSCSTSLAELQSDSADVRERAALALYRQCDRAALRAQPNAAAFLRKSVELGNGSAAAVLLLGSFSDPQTRETLRVAAEASKNLKLEAWLEPVSPSVPVAIARARQAAPGASAELGNAVAQESLATRVFVLSVLSELEDRSGLRAVTTYLRDPREIAGGVPSGATPRRRLCDLAVDALVERFQLKLGFPLRPSARYEAEQIREVERAVQAALDG